MADRFYIAVGISVALHVVLFASARSIPAAKNEAPRFVEMKMVSAPKPPPPPPPVEEPPPPKPEEPKTLPPKPKPKKDKIEEPPPKTEAPPAKEEPPPPPEKPVVFSVDMAATVAGEGGVQVKAVEGGGNPFADPEDQRDGVAEKRTTPQPAPSGQGTDPMGGEVVRTPPEFLTPLSDRSPPYPDEAQKAEIEGRVLLRIYIDETGKVTQAQVVQSLGYGCDEQARKYALTKWRFKPATVGGVAVGMWIPVPVTFVLER